MTDKGGAAATRGFLVQALVALLESLRLPDWSVVSIEPELASEKVDILWQLLDDTERHSQVKNRSEGIELGAVKAWAKALKRESPRAFCVLHLCGPATRGVAKAKVIQDVTLKLCGHDLDALYALCSTALHAVLDSRGLYGRSHAVLNEGIDRLAGVLFAGSSRRRKWSPVELWHEVERAVAVDVPSSLLRPDISWSQCRIIEVHASGDCTETHITSYFNNNDFENYVPSTLIRVTESVTRTEAVWDGLPDVTWQAAIMNGVYTIWVAPRPSMPARSARNVAVRVWRGKCAEVGPSELNYGDTALPPDDGAPVCLVNTWVVLPDRWHGGSLEATAAEVITGGVAGWLFQAEEYRKFRINAHVAAAPAPDPLATALRALAAYVTGGAKMEQREIATLCSHPQVVRLLGRGLLGSLT